MRQPGQLHTQMKNLSLIVALGAIACLSVAARAEDLEVSRALSLSVCLSLNYSAAARSRSRPGGTPAPFAPPYEPAADERIGAEPAEVLALLSVLSPNCLLPPSAPFHVGRRPLISTFGG